MEEQQNIQVCIDIVIKNIDWITLSMATTLRDEIKEMIQTTFQASIDVNDQVEFISFDHLQLLHNAKNMDDVIQYIYRIDDAIYTMQNPYVHERLFLGIGLYILQADEDIPFAMANAKFARIHDDDAFKLHTHIGIYNQTKRLACLFKHHYEHMLRIAYVQDDITFALQPKIPLDDHLPFAAEALLRCPSISSSITNYDIVQLAEANGMICELDIRVFEKVCMYQKQRSLQLSPLFPISVNLSRMHFKDVSFFDTYIEIFEKYALPLTCISFEVTESAWTSTPCINTILAQIKAYGFTCALDDFGSGVSSLMALKDLPMDTIKIDRQFFLQKNGRSNIILEAMVMMIKKLGYLVVAEGVEEQGDINNLKAWGCDYIQCYLYAKPMSPDTMNTFHQEWSDSQKKQSR